MAGVINLGDIVFGLGPDTSRLRTALRDILDFGEAVENAAANAADGGAKTEAAFRRQEAAIVRSLEQMRKFNDELRAAGTTRGAPTDILKASQNAFKDLTAQMTSGALTPLQYQRAMEQFTASMQRNQRSFVDWTKEQERAKSLNFTGFLQQMATAASLVTGPLGGVAFRLALLSRLFEEGQLHLALWVGGITLIAQGVLKLAESTLKAELGLSRMRMQMEALGKTSGETKDDMNFILTISERFGVPFEDIAQHFVKMELAAKGTRMEGSNMLTTFQDIVAYAGRMRLSQQELDQAIDLTTRSITRQRLTIQDLRQISNLVPAFRKIAEDAMGTSAGGFNLMIKRGEILTDTFWTKFWEGALKERGIDPLARITGSIAASQGRLKNAMLEVNNAFNEAIGLTDKYTGSLDRVTSAMEFLARNMDIILKAAGAITAALVGGFLSAAVVTRIGAIIEAISALRTAFLTAGASALLMTGPLAALAGLAGAVIAGVGAFLFLDSAIGKTTGTLIDSKSSIDEYIKRYEDARKGASMLTAEQLKLAQANLIAAKSALAAAEAAATATPVGEPKKAGTEAAKTWWESFLEYFRQVGQMSEVGQIAAAIESATAAAARDAAKETATRLTADVAHIQEQINKLNKMIDDQRARERSQKGPALEDTQAAIRLATVKREYAELVDETNRTFAAMQKGPKALADTLEEIQIEKTLETWRRKFNELNFSTDQTNKLLGTLEVSLRKVADAKKFDKEFMSMGQTLQFAFGELGKNAIDKFSNALVEGTLKTLKFKDFVVQALEAIIKKLLELSVLAPMMNALFGTNQQAFSLTSGGTGTGGFIGGLLKMIGLQGTPTSGFDTSLGVGGPGWSAPMTGGSFVAPHAGSGAPMFRFADPSIFMRAPRLHSGLMPDEYPAILQSGERVTPRGGGNGSGGGNNVMIKISHPPDTQAKTRSDTQGGLDIHEVIISHVQRGITTGKLDPLMASRYGSRPRATLR